MSFDTNPADEDPHLDCQREIVRLEARVSELEAENIEKTKRIAAVESERDRHRVQALKMAENWIAEIREAWDDEG